VAMPRIMDYTAYYPLYNPRSLVTQSQIAKYSTNFSTGLTILNSRSVLIIPYDILKDLRKKGAKRFLFSGTMAVVLGEAECRLHPLIHTFGPSILTLRYGGWISRGKV
ncbi:MAG: hypothetical protein V3W17_05010, partial [Desulfobacteria bacterium]